VVPIERHVNRHRRPLCARHLAQSIERAARRVPTRKKLPTMGDDAINTMKLIDSVYRAAGLPVRGTQL
jgi:hypothetical protein